MIGSAVLVSWPIGLPSAVLVAAVIGFVVGRRFAATNRVAGTATGQLDPLTGICDRPTFDEMLTSLLALKNRYEQDFTLVKFDIDAFREINSAEGRDTGDAVLRGLASTVAAAVRETDTVARFGGEEFVVLMPHTSLGAAMDFCDRLRLAIQRARHAGVAVTVSGGAVAPADGEDAQSLMRRADVALEAAKTAGRNQVFVHDGQQVFALNSNAVTLA